MGDRKNRKPLNWQQACAILGCGRSQFYNLVNSGKIKSVRFGDVKGVRVYEEDCLAYLYRDKKEILA